MKKLILSSLFAGAATLALNAQVAQKVILEEFTGAWCGYCPDGALIVEDITSTNPDVYGVSVHNGDGMVTSAGNSVDAFFNSLGYPSATLNRSGGSIDRGSWTSASNSMTGMNSDMSLSFESWTYDGSTGAISVTVRVEAFAAYTGTHRLNLILTEDLVTGTGSGYNQANYYNTTVGSPLYGLGNPILGYEHNHVARSYVGGAWGVPTVIPYSVPAGFVTTYTFNATLNAAWNPDNMHLIAYVGNYAGVGLTERSIINSESIPMTTVTGVKDAVSASNMSISVAPNPMSERTSATFTLAKTGQVKVEVVNAMGQQIDVLSEGLMTAGTHTETWIASDAAPGIYFVRVTSDAGETQSAKVIVAR